MDSDEELPFSDSENQPSPVPARKLKRLRKATEKVTKDLPSPPSSTDSPPGHEVNGSEAVVDRGETTNTEDSEVLSVRSGSRLEGLEEGFKLDSGFETEQVCRVAKRHLEFDSLSEGFDGKGEEKLDTEMEEGSEDLGKNEGLEKKWRNLGEFDEVRASAKRNLGFDSLSEEFDGKGGGRLDTEVEEESEDLRLNEGLEKKWRDLGEFDGDRGSAKRHLGFDSFSEEFDGKDEEKLDTEMEETEDLRLNEGLEKTRNSDGFEEVGGGAKRNLGFDEEIDGKDGDKLDTDVDESGDLRTNEGLEKKRKNLDGFEEKREKKRKKRKVKDANDVYDDENLFSVVSPKKIGKKERRERLQELRAESQRLLRETREASFKPVLFVQKSVSSVLAKIRQRKQELSKKLVNMAENSYTDGYDTISREAHKDADIDKEELTSIPVAAEVSVEAEDVQGSKETSNQSDKNVISKMATPDDLKQTFRAPVEDSQDLIFYSVESDSKDEIPSSPLEDVLAPSLTAMNLKFDSALPDDFSDDEDDNNKIIEEDNNKNIDPLRHCVADLTSSRKGDPVKAFVDDEAEEEDDSDDDRARFQDNEEDEDDTDSEELNDMIATAYEEQPVDNEMRNQLHQKWLEQQDAVGTENLLQRLKCDSKQRETAFMEEREDKGTEGEESEDEEFDNDPAEGLLPRNVVRMNLKKAKEMIHLMFTDKYDVYVSSDDDEETEKTLFKRHLSHKTEDQTTFLSPAEDKSSKDIFGLIKKLNGAPDARRKAKIATYSNTLSLGGNKTASSKLSFLSRGSRNSLPSIQKHGSSAVRSFVFERDDSNSRSAILTVEDSSDTVQRENRPKKTVSAKFSNSQVKSSSQSTQKKPGPSLHEILRCPPPIQSSHRTSNNMAGEVEAIYAAFKLDQYPIKKEPGLSIRTA